MTLLEVRPLWLGKQREVTKSPYAKFRYVQTGGLWQIYWRRASGNWHAYEPDPVASDLVEVLKIIEADRCGCFFGERFEARLKEKIAPSCIRTFAAVGLHNLQTLTGSHHRPAARRSPMTIHRPKAKTPVIADRGFHIWWPGAESNRAEDEWSGYYYSHLHDVTPLAPSSCCQVTI